MKSSFNCHIVESLTFPLIKYNQVLVVHPIHRCVAWQEWCSSPTESQSRTKDLNFLPCICLLLSSSNTHYTDKFLSWGSVMWEYCYCVWFVVQLRYFAVEKKEKNENNHPVRQEEWGKISELELMFTWKPLKDPWVVLGPRFGNPPATAPNSSRWKKRTSGVRAWSRSSVIAGDRAVRKNTHRTQSHRCVGWKNR